MSDWQRDSLELGLDSREFRVSLPDAEVTDFRTRVWQGKDVPRALEELKPHYPTIPHALFHAMKVGDDAGLTLLGEKESDPLETRRWADIAMEAHRIAARLASKGIAKGDRVMLVLPTSVELITTFFGIQLLRAVPVPTYPPAMLERAESAIEKMQKIADSAKVRAVVTNRKLRLLIGELARDDRPLVSTENLLGDGELGEVQRRIRRSEPAFVQYTSGSTGNPKGVVLSHANIVANVHAIGQALEINRHDVTVSWLPLYHDMGLIGTLLFSIYWRIPLVLMSPSAFLLNPRRWLQAMTDYRGTLCAAPNFGYARCVKRVRDLEGLDLSSWRIALNGAEPVNAKTLDAFSEKFGAVGFRKKTFFPVYGLAEATLAVSFPGVHDEPITETVDRERLAFGHAEPAQEGARSVTLVSVGTSVPGHQVFVVDAHGQELPEREVGHVVVRGPSTMQGYLDEPERTREVLRDQTLWTGDLGYRSEGQLYVTGRVKDLIIVRGKNYYAEDMEVVAEQIDGVRAGCCVAFGVYDEEKASDLLVVVAETKLEDEQAQKILATSVAERVQTACGLRVDEVVLVPPGTIPKTSSGKRQRALCRDLYLRDELETRRTSTLKLAMVFARSGVGFVGAQMGKLLKRRPTHD